MSVANRSLVVLNPKVIFLPGYLFDRGEQLGVVAIDDEQALGIQAADDAGVFAPHAHQVAEKLQMLGAAVGDDGDVGRGHVAEDADLAVMVRAHFEHEIILDRVGGEDRQRDADVVVEALGRDRAAELAAQGGVDQVFGAGFAVAAGDGDDLRPHLLAAEVGAACPSRRVVSGTSISMTLGEALFGRMFDQRRDRAAGGGLGQESWALWLSPRRAMNSEPRFHPPGVGADRLDQRCVGRDRR